MDDQFDRGCSIEDARAKLDAFVTTLSQRQLDLSSTEANLELLRTTPAFAWSVIMSCANRCEQSFWRRFVLKNRTFANTGPGQNSGKL